MDIGLLAMPCATPRHGTIPKGAQGQTPKGRRVGPKRGAGSDLKGAQGKRLAYGEFGYASRGVLAVATGNRCVSMKATCASVGKMRKIPLAPCKRDVIYFFRSRGAGALRATSRDGGEIPLRRIRYFALTRKRRSVRNLAVSIVRIVQ